MDDLFVKFKLAAKLKSIGFNSPCIWYYFDGITNTSINLEPLDYNADANSSMYISKPLISQVFKWFREEYNLVGVPSMDAYFIYSITDGYSECAIEEYPLTSFEEAEEDCINKLIDIVQDESN